MAVSPTKLIQERIRQEITGDTSFFTKQLYYFELRIPSHMSVVAIDRYLFPLAINPESYSMEEPFTLEKTPTQGGGLYVEENGIVERTIRISGTTGFKPRALPNTQMTALSVRKPASQSYGRTLPKAVLGPISGQRHFQYLQDSVFRTYADLKRDPAASEGTLLFFHNPKDDEHWLVAPINFKLERSKDQPHMYQYDIQLLVLDRAEAADADFSEDKALFESMKDSLRSVKAGLDLAAGAFNDLTALVDELENFIKNISKILDGVSTILDSVSNFVDGVVDFIESPYALVESVIGIIEADLRTHDTWERAGTDVSGIGDNIIQKFMQMADGLTVIAIHPEIFEAKAQARMREAKRRQELLLAANEDALTTARDSTPPQTIQDSKNLGTAITPGDVRSAESELGVGRDVFDYTGAHPYTIGEGDTLVNLAARFLKDARLWQHIAVVNGLKPPFLLDQANADLTSDSEVLPGVLGIGSTILIPTFAKSPSQLPTLPVLGVRREESAESQMLGTDLALVMVGGRTGAPLYDIPIDTAGGSVDAKTVTGLANMGQVMILWLATEKGTDPMYKTVGLNRVIGTNVVPADLGQARLHVREALLRDPRVASIQSLKFRADNDLLGVDVDVGLHGYTETSNILATLRS